MTHLESLSVFGPVAYSFCWEWFGDAYKAREFRWEGGMVTRLCLTTKGSLLLTNTSLWQIFGDGRKAEISCFRFLDVVMHCTKDVEVTEGCGEYAWSTVRPLLILRDPGGARYCPGSHRGHMLYGRVLFRKKFGNYVEATRVHPRLQQHS